MYEDIESLKSLFNKKMHDKYDLDVEILKLYDYMDEETALREVFEEVGLTVKLVPGFRSEDEHPIPGKENTLKQIVYFLGEYSNQEFIYQREELTDALLVDYETAISLFQFDSSKRILTAANNFLLSR